MIKRDVNGKVLFLLVLALVCPARYAHTQNNTVTINGSIDTSQFPQWTKDLRRWEIVAFGSFPFTMFFATFGMDTYRFAGTGWSDTRYAPWPLKSAGAIEMTNKEYETTMIIAASLSAVIAFADLIIVQVKRHKARQYAESLPVGTTIITRRPWPLVYEPEELPEEADRSPEMTNEETAAEVPIPEQPRNP